MKRLFVGILTLCVLLSFCACKSTVTENETGTNDKPQAKAIGESFVTDNFTLTVSDFQFVRSVSMGDYFYDHEDIVNDAHSSDTVIAYFRFNINNTGANTYDLFVHTPALVSGDIRYDGGLNGIAKYYCITTDDANGRISPFENKEYNYCIFNVPTAMMSQSSLALEFELDGVTYTYTIK